MTRERADDLVWDFEDTVLACERDGYSRHTRLARTEARDALINALMAEGEHDKGNA